MKKFLVTITFILGITCLGNGYETYLEQEIEYLKNIIKWNQHTEEVDWHQLRYLEGRMYELEQILENYRNYKDELGKKKDYIKNRILIRELSIMNGIQEPYVVFDVEKGQETKELDFLELYHLYGQLELLGRRD